MKTTTLTVILIWLSFAAVAQTNPKVIHIAKADTVTIYKNGKRRVVIGKKVFFIRANVNVEFGDVNVCLYHTGNHNIYIDSLSNSPIIIK